MQRLALLGYLFSGGDNPRATTRDIIIIRVRLCVMGHIVMRPRRNASFPYTANYNVIDETDTRNRACYMVALESVFVQERSPLRVAR